LKDPEKMIRIVKGVVDVVDIPVSVKTRLGLDSKSIIIEELVYELQKVGVAKVIIHARTRAQMYTGDADWTLIGEVKKNPRIHIPIIGNGDIKSIEDANKAFDTYGVDAVMIGRATFGCPWLFYPTPLTLDEKIDTLLEQLHINVERLDEKRGILHTRRHLAASPLFKGIPDFRQTRIAMLRAETVADLTRIIEDTRVMLKDMEN
jgi:tRNA-dihydrouridine synthase